MEQKKSLKVFLRTKNSYAANILDQKHFFYPNIYLYHFFYKTFFYIFFSDKIFCLSQKFSSHHYFGLEYSNFSEEKLVAD